MEVEVRSKVCSTCPFRKKFAHQIIVGTVADMLINGTISPCHQELKHYTGSTTDGVELYAELAPVFKVCRGYTEARMLAHINADIPVWKKIYGQFFEHGYSDEVVNMKDVL